MPRQLITSTLSYAAARSDVHFPSLAIGILIGSLSTALTIFLQTYLHRRQQARTQDEQRRFAAHRPDSIVAVQHRQLGSATKFSDVAGNEAAKEQLMDLVDFLSNPSRYIVQGAKLPKGVLLTGPPGVGKTLLAKAMAGEAGVPFLSASGSDFQEMYVGVGARRVRDLFSKARTNSRCVIFIDEFDGLARKREDAHEESARTLNAFLTEMDGFSSNDSIIVIAATNFPELLDQAAVRPGRFDRHVEILPPDAVAREHILRLHARGKRMGQIDFMELARRTAGMNGAHLAALLNEAAILSVKERAVNIEMCHIDEAMARVIAGLKHTRADPAIRQRIAIHEAGHAIVAWAIGRSIEYVTIEPRGRALGYVFYSEKADSLLLTESDLADELLILLGGRAAEFLCLGDRSTGAANDIERAMELAARMIGTYGMGDALGIQKPSDEEVVRRLTLYDQRVLQTLEQHRDRHRVLVERLLAQDRVEGKNIGILTLDDKVFAEGL